MGALTQRIAELPAEKQAALLQRLQRRRGVAPPDAASDRWFFRRRPDPQARMRLFCFPYAGGGAGVFRTWTDELPPDVEVLAAQLPGREARVGEKPFTRIGPLVDALATAIRPHLDRPFMFFGHSMGALVAFELARHLRREHLPQPDRLMLAAYRAPQLPNPNIKIYHLPDEVLKVVLQTDGTPQRILQNDELMRAMLPTLRADFELCDTYEYREEPPLDYPLSIFGGTEDVRISAGDLDGWRAHAGAGCTFTRVPGGHFFVHSAQDLLLAAIAEVLDGGRSAPGRPAVHDPTADKETSNA
ncbi:alpha/beta fold hydrolase [Micromonospora sp. WMMA1998]|uniref:thioesterase II family protein n=1 Tax=Micromonospora sp. WMMA1998 TaxID=3015167 RepID=UPI00248B22DC|nr:alpha/beta fold hydrolase [Micromonospora sp. WMMA1998]WBC14938.1 alpha/beta fold hydrolase [Micromonospora sp. WMMA1998]